MTMNEGEVWSVFGTYLIERGCDVATGPDIAADVLDSESYEDFGSITARRGAEVLVAGFLGHAEPAGPAADLAYGKLLRRMAPDLLDATFVLVAPEALRWHVERVPAEVRRRCGIEVYLINDLAGVRKL